MVMAIEKNAGKNQRFSGHFFTLGKKAMADWGFVFWQQWSEAFFIIVLIVGFLVALFIKNAIFVYIIIFCIGLMAGRAIFKKKGKQPLFPFFLIIIGFFIGYLIGAFNFNKKMITFLFIAGAIISYYIHKKGYVK